jgi:hypothetical protein
LESSQDISNNQPLNDEQKFTYIERMKAAWAKLPEDKKAALKPTLDEADAEYANFLNTKKAPQHKFHNILRMKSYLTDDWDGKLRLQQQQIDANVAIGLGPEGEILGTGKYEQLDLCWELVAGTVWLENLLYKHPFPPGTPPLIQVPDLGTQKLKIAIAGDFGTGNFGASDSPSTKISKIMRTLQPHVTIHLGDVYYAGTGSDESTKLLNFWPPGSLHSFTLNSNHEMYAGGGPYFNQAVGGPLFNLSQSPWSYFAFEYGDWIVVGLDSAYCSGVMDLYMKGSLGNNNGQKAFLKAVAQSGKQVIVLTHHNGLELDGSRQTQLFDEVMAAFEGVNPPAYWYWGHKHAGVVYAQMKGTYFRCTGHAALPWGCSSQLSDSGLVDWFEKKNANDPAQKLRVCNGFTLLELDAHNLSETFIDEMGRVAWTPSMGDTRPDPGKKCPSN